MSVPQNSAINIDSGQLHFKRRLTKEEENVQVEVEFCLVLCQILVEMSGWTSQHHCEKPGRLFPTI